MLLAAVIKTENHMNEQKERAWNDIFALRLAELMKNRGMRQSELAVGIGSPQNTVGRYIKGRLCKVSKLLKNAKFFNVPIVFLLGLAEPETRAKETDQPPSTLHNIGATKDAIRRMRRAAIDLLDAAEKLERES